MKTAALIVAAAAAAASGQTATMNGSFGPGGFAAIEFFTNGISAGSWLDITSNGSTNPDASGADTEIGLYFGTGAAATLVGEDDDDGIGLTSTLSYGDGSGLMLGDSFNLGGDGLANGEDGGSLAAGFYTLIVGEFSTGFPGVLGDFGGDTGDEAVDYTVSFYTNDQGFFVVPTPGAAAVLGLGGLVAVRRRR